MNMIGNGTFNMMQKATAVTAVTDAVVNIGKKQYRSVIGGTGINQVYALPDAATIPIYSPYQITNAGANFVGITKSDGSGMRRLPPGCTMTCISQDTATPGAWFCDRTRMGVVGVDLYEPLSYAPGNAAAVFVATGGGWSGSGGSLGAGWLGGHRYVVTTNGGYGGFRGGNTGAFRLNDGYPAHVSYSRFQMINLADTTNDYFMQLGLGDSTTAADNTNHVVLEYNRSVSLNWLLRAKTGAADTTTDSGVPVALGLTAMKSVEVSSDGSRADFWVDNTHIGSVTTNIPTALGMVFMGRAVKTVGTGLKIAAHMSGLSMIAARTE